MKFTQSFLVVIFLSVSFLGYTQSGPPYPVYWINLIRVSGSGSILTKNSGPNSWGAGAISSNVLAPNINGSMEFAGGSGAHCIVGLAANNIIDLDKFSHGIYLDQASNYYAIYEGSTGTALGGWQVGDIFKIAREGDLVRYYRNGVVVRSVAVTPGVALQVKAAIRFSGKSTPAISTSFDGNLTIQGNVTSIVGNNTSGAIALTSSGGAAPYTYSWSSGEQTNIISNKSIGSYTVTVNDAAGHVQMRNYEIGHTLYWINPLLATSAAGGTSITKQNVPATWGAGAISSNVLSANTDGWIEFSGRYDDHFIIGLSVHDVIDIDKFSHAIFVDYQNNRFRIHEGETITSFASWQTGDIFRISRVGDVVNYYRNGTIIRTITVDPTAVLKAKAALQYAGQSTPIINTSFAGQMILYGTVTGMEGNSGSGSIALNVSGSSTPYVYTWSSGEQTASISNKQRGAYSVSVADGIGGQKTRIYHLGYKVIWINPIGASLSDGILTKTATGRTWDNAGAVSSNILMANTDGWIEFSTYSRDDFTIGLAVNNTIAITGFSHAVAVDHLTNNYVLYSGSAIVGSGNWQTGDVFRISREGDVVNYYKNDDIIKVVNVNAALVLKVKASIKYQTKSTPVINASFWNSDGIVRTYYSIASGNWTTPSIWSLTENGPPSTVYPDDVDKVVIKGHEVTINSGVNSAGITLKAVDNVTNLKVDGNTAALTVKGNCDES